MGINFEPGLNVGDTFVAGGKIWVWDGDKWSLSGGSASGGGGISGDYVEKTGDEMSGDLLLKDPKGDTSTISFSSDEATAVHKKYVDDKINQIDLEIDIDHGAWSYEVPDIVDHVGTATLVIPSYIQQITPYTFEVQWEGGINESDVVIEWTATRDGIDISDGVFNEHAPRSYIGFSRVSAIFTDEGEHEISCKITSDLSSEVVEVSPSIVDVQFYDGIAKIGDVVMDPINNYKMAQTATYTPSSLGDADDVKYTFAYSEKTAATRPRIFDRQRVITNFEENVIPSIQSDMKQYFRDTVVYSMDLWETYLQYNDDAYWSMWHSCRVAKFDPSLDDDHQWNKPWSGFYLDWSAYQSSTDGALAWGGTNGDHDSEVNIPYTTVFSNPRSGNVKVNMHYANYGNVGWSKEYTQAYFRTTLPHEIGHCLGLFIPTRGWYEHDGVDRFEDNTGVYHYAQYPKLVQAYRDLTGDQSFDRVYNNYGDSGHIIGHPRTWHGKLYPGVQSLMSVVGGEHRKITILELKLAADIGWEEVNPGSSAEPNPPLFYTREASVAASTDEFHPEGFIECTGHDHPDWLDRLPYINEPYNSNLRRGGGAPADYGSTSAPGYSPGVKDFSGPLVRTESDSTLSIVFKTPSQWDVTATATSDTANDGPKIKSIVQDVLSIDTRAIDLFVAPYDDTFVANPNPGTYHLFDENGNVTGDYELAKTIKISDTDLSGSEHTWGKIAENLEVDIKNFANGDYLAGQITQIASDPSDDHIELKVDLLDYKGFTLDGDEAEIKFVEGNNLFVKVAGDTMEGPLEMKPETGKATIIINGSSDDVNEPASGLSFKNQSVSDSDKAGLLEFHSNDTSQYFKFDKDVDLGSNGLHSVARLRFIADGTIQVNKTDKILFRNPQNGNEGNAAVEIQRAPNTRRTFAIRGKKSDDTEGDILSVYANNDGQGGDAINYVGKMVGGSNLINKDYVDYRYGPGRLNIIQHRSKWKGGTDPFSDSNFCTIDINGNSTQYRDSIRGIVVYEGFGEGTTPGGVGGRLTRNLWRTGSYVEIVNPNNGGLWLSGKITSYSRNNGMATIKFDRIWNEPFEFTQNQECNVYITGI